MTLRTSPLPFVLSVSFALCALACHPNKAGIEPDPGSSANAKSSKDGGAEVDAPQPGYPGELISTDAMTQDFLARQQLQGSFGDQDFKFEAVLQLRNGTLTVLGLTPFGTKAFVLEQTGTEVTFKPLIEREIPFPPEYMLQDIHRAWLWHARLPWTDQPPAESAVSAEVDGERVTETWTDNGLVRRTFERIEGDPGGQITIDYVGGHQSGRPAKHVVLDNGWFGYRLEIKTTEWRAL